MIHKQVHLEEKFAVRTEHMSAGARRVNEYTEVGEGKENEKIIYKNIPLQFERCQLHSRAVQELYNSQ